MPTPSSTMRPSGRSTTSTAPWASTCRISSARRASSTTSSCPSGGSRHWSCAAACSPAAAAAAAAVSAAGSASRPRRTRTTSTWTRRTWRPRSRPIRTEQVTARLSCSPPPAPSQAPPPKTRARPSRSPNDSSKHPHSDPAAFHSQHLGLRPVNGQASHSTSPGSAEDIEKTPDTPPCASSVRRPIAALPPSSPMPTLLRSSAMWFVFFNL